jgi:ubiquinone/menaquinone biosynthesis C-methylase UbiE
VAKPVRLPPALRRRTSEHFDQLAARYSELRASDASVDPVTEAVAGIGALRGCRVLDVGCGPGTVLQQLIRAYDVDGVGVDASAEMIAAARREAPEVGEFRLGAAERLPFEDGEFDAVLMRMVVHHIDRPLAFAEAKRVLGSGGRFVITTSDPDAIPGFWLSRYFPTFSDIDRARFPNGEMLREELEQLAFTDVRVLPYTLPRRFDRQAALEKLRARAYSTFALMSDEEYRSGVAAAEAGLPAVVEYDLRLLNVIAVRP